MTTELAWACGIFEGEGSIIVDSRPTRNSVYLTVQMTDKDTLDKLQFVVGKGNVKGPYKTKGQPTWKWGLYKAEDVLELLQLWLPYLSIRRSEKAKLAILQLVKVRTECRQGHKFTPENTSFTKKRGLRQCKTCNKLRARLYRKRG